MNWVTQAVGDFMRQLVADRISMAALLVSSLALCISFFSAKYARSQARAAVNSDIRITLKEYREQLRAAREIKDAVSFDVKQAKAAIKRLERDSEVAVPGRLDSAVLAETLSDFGSVAGVKIDPEQMRLLRDLMTVEDDVLSRLQRVKQIGPRGPAHALADAVLEAEKAINRLEKLGIPIVNMQSAINPQAAGRIRKLQKRIK